MRELHGFVVSFYVDESAVTSIEYALIAVLIATVIVIAVAAVGSNLAAIFGRVANCFPSGAC